MQWAASLPNNYTIISVRHPSSSLNTGHCLPPTADNLEALVVTRPVCWQFSIAIMPEQSPGRGDHWFPVHVALHANCSQTRVCLQAVCGLKFAELAADPTVGHTQIVYVGLWAFIHSFIHLFIYLFRICFWFFCVGKTWVQGTHLYNKGTAM